MGKRTLIAGLLAMTAAGLLAGCGSSSPTRSTSRSHTTTTIRRIVAWSPCTHSGEVRAGVLDPFRVGAIDFSSPSHGIGLTAGAFLCYRPDKGGVEGKNHYTAVQLARTTDGGRTWSPFGRPVPVPLKSGTDYGESVVTVSPSTFWVIAGKGSAFLTTDRGGTWTAAPLPRPVLSLQARDGYLWALSCQYHGGPCRAAVFRRDLAASGAGGWTKLAGPRLTVSPSPELALLSGGRAVLSVNPPGGSTAKLFVINADTSRWRLLPQPHWGGGRCWLGQIATSDHNIWVLCLGGAAAGSSEKALLISTDGGSSWRVRSSVTSLSKPQSPTGIPLSEPSALIATTDLKLWMGLQNGLATSGDGGRHWSYTRNVNPQGVPLTFDVISPTRVFALAPGAGMWRTTDGTNWTALGPLNTG